MNSDHKDRADNDDMVDAAKDMSNEAVTDDVAGQLNEIGHEFGESMAEDVLGQGLEAVLDSIPLASLPIIIGTEALNVVRGRATLRESWQRGKGRLARAGVYSTIGAAVNATPAAPASVPITVGLRLVQTRVGHRVAMGSHLEEKTQEIIRVLETTRGQKSIPRNIPPKSNPRGPA